MSTLNIVFAGTPEFGLPCLDALIQSPHHLQAIYTQPDRPAGRGRKVQASAVKEWALSHSIPVYQPLNFKNSAAIAELAALKPDVLVVIAYGLILPRAVLDIPRLGCINVHASLLPRWRGASPIQQAILHGDGQSGVTIMQMDVGLDTGNMLSKVHYSMSNKDTAQTLHDTLSLLSAQPLLNVLEGLATDTIISEVQDDELVTYAHKIHKEDACIQWHNSAVSIDRQIRAYNPWPSAYTLLQEHILRIHQAQVLSSTHSQLPGTILHIEKKGITVATGDQLLLIEKIQFPGARAITVADWLNSGKTQLQVGSIFS
ncbi:MAG: methionyl-tRNA formyltransferase [bacterium]|nr:methionyl-tRNA formyltransferase [bacterium]